MVRASSGSSGGARRRILRPATSVPRCCRVRAPGWTTKGRSVSVCRRRSRSSNDMPVARPCSGSAARLRYRKIRGLLWRLIQEMDGTEHDGGDRVAASGPRACSGCANGRRAGRGRRHRRVRPICRPVPPSRHEEGRLAGRGSGWRRRPATRDGRELPRVSGGADGSPSAEAVPDRLRGFHALTRSRRSNRDYRVLAAEPARFRCAAPHVVRGHRFDAVGGP